MDANKINEIAERHAEQIRAEVEAEAAKSAEQLEAEALHIEAEQLGGNVLAWSRDYSKNAARIQTARERQKAVMARLRELEGSPSQPVNSHHVVNNQFRAYAR